MHCQLNQQPYSSSLGVLTVAGNISRESGCWTLHKLLTKAQRMQWPLLAQRQSQLRCRASSDAEPAQMQSQQGKAGEQGGTGKGPLIHHKLEIKAADKDIEAAKLVCIGTRA